MLSVVLVVVCLALGVWAPVAEATSVRYRGSVYRGLTADTVREGGATLSVAVSVPVFPTNTTRLQWILARMLATIVRLVDEDGVIVNSTTSMWQRVQSGNSTAPWDAGSSGEGGGVSVGTAVRTDRAVGGNATGHADVLAAWQRAVGVMASRSRVEVADGGHVLRVALAGVAWDVPAALGVLVVPCLPFELLEGVGRVGALDMPSNCLAGDPFMVRRRPFVHLDEARWRARWEGQLLVTGSPVEVPLAGAARDTLDKFLIERDLRVVEGSTCLHTRNAFVRGSVWDMHRRVYRYTPHRGGVQTLCYAPYPETLPLLRVKLLDSLEVAGPEGVSTDPPQVRAELEFVGTIYGTNLTERDTAVMTDELCTDFTSQNVFFVELLYSSASRVSFSGTFHKRGIYHVCYHRAGAAAYVRVSTLLVDRGSEVVIDSGSTNVLIDHDVKLLESATVLRLKVQDKGHLELRQRSLNVSYFVWSGGAISGKGTVNCTGFAKITTQGYETRQLSVPLYNYGEMTIDVQRLLLDRDGAIHNYGNLTLAVSSMGVDGISSVLSMGRHNTINNHAGGVLRIVALDERSYALLTSRIVLWGGSTVVSGRVNVTDLSNGVQAALVLKRGAGLTTYNARLGGRVTVEARGSLVLMEGCALMSTAVDGAGAVHVLGEGVLLDSVNASGAVRFLVGAAGAAAAAPPASAASSASGSVSAADGALAPVDSGAAPAAGPIVSVSVYGAAVFGPQTHVEVGRAAFVTTTGLAKMLFYGSVVALLGGAHFGENMIVQAGGTTVLYGDLLGSGRHWPGRVLADPLDAAAAGGAVVHHGTAAAAAGGAAHERSVVASLLVPPNATLFVVDTAGLDDGASAAAAAAGGGSGGPCAAHRWVTDYLVLGGRLVLRGCAGIALGGSVSGSVERLSRPADWELLASVACRGSAGGAVAASAAAGAPGSAGGDWDRDAAVRAALLCRGGSGVVAVPAAAYSGVALSSDMHIRAPGVIAVDELVLASGRLRSDDALVLRGAERVVVRAGATLAMLGGGRVEARELLVEGTLDLGVPRLTHIAGNVTVADGGLVQLRGVNAPCHSVFRSVVSGNVTSAGEKAFECTITGPASMVVVEGRGEVGSYDLWEVGLRRRTLFGLPPFMSCPVPVMREVDMFRGYFFGLDDEIPSRTVTASYPQLALISLGMLLWSSLMLRLSLWWWGSDLLEFMTDLARKPKISVNFSWQEMTQNYLNFVFIGLNLHTRLQGVLAAFCGTLPYPLPFTACLAVRSHHVLNAHRGYEHPESTCLGVLIIVACVSTLLSRHPHVSRTWQGYIGTAQVLSNTILAFVKLPVLSWLLEGVFCNTVFVQDATCTPYLSWGKLLFSVVTFTAVSFTVPWNLTHLMVGQHQMHAREKASWTLLLCFLDPLELFMWRLAPGTGLGLVYNSLLVQLVRVYLFIRLKPIAYVNVQKFIFNLVFGPFVVYLAIIGHTYWARLGYMTSCTSGDYLFRGIFLLTALNTLRAFYVHIYCADYSPVSSDMQVDAIQRSMQQLRARVDNVKETLYMTTDPADRENILNALARLRIELLEKQEQYRYEVERLLRPFYLGARYADIDGARTGRSGALAGGSTRYGNEASPQAVEAALRDSVSPTSFHSGLLTAEEMESFSCGPALGKGSYGTVHLGILTNGKLVAVKYVSVLSDNRESLASVMAEVNMLRELSHPNIIRYYGAHTIRDTMLVFMEFAVGGSLTSIVRKFTGLTESVMQLYTYQILRGLQYLHSKGVVHRDIKGENILIDGYGVAKLSDFGCSKSLANIANGSEAGCGTLVGSPFWMAPEVIRSEAYGTKADIWSVGCTVVEMLNGGDPPWRDEFDNVYSAMFYVGSTDDIPQIPEDTSEECMDFLHRCFVRDVAHRATAAELLEHPWLRAAHASSDLTNDLSRTFSHIHGTSSPRESRGSFLSSSFSSHLTKSRVSEP